MLSLLNMCKYCEKKQHYLLSSMGPSVTPTVIFSVALNAESDSSILCPACSLSKVPPRQTCLYVFKTLSPWPCVADVDPVAATDSVPLDAVGPAVDPAVLGFVSSVAGVVKSFSTLGSGWMTIHWERWLRIWSEGSRLSVITSWGEELSSWGQLGTVYEQMRHVTHQKIMDNVARYNFTLFSVSIMCNFLSFM